MQTSLNRSAPQALIGQRWIFVEDSEFLPAHGGGEREHLGMLEAARDSGILSVIILPVSGSPDLTEYRLRFPGVPILPIKRHLGAWRLLDPRFPYTVSSRRAPRALPRVVASCAPDANGIIVTSYKSWSIAADLARVLDLPVVLRMHNLEGPYHQSLADGSSGPRALALQLEAKRIQRDELRLQTQDWLTGIADISRSDAQWRIDHGATRVDHVPPFAVRLAGDHTPRPTPQDPTVVFVGALDVPTNTDAVAWLAQKVWPTIRQRVPKATLLVVGRNPGQALVREVQALPGAAVRANVPDVQPFLDQARVAVNPAVSGSGVNIKLVEYLAAGIPVVSTSHALRGLDLRAGTDLLVADDPAGFAAAVISLIEDPSLASQVGESGAQAIRSILDEQANLVRVARLLQR